jgi:hypothetical protein
VDLIIVIIIITTTTTTIIIIIIPAGIIPIETSELLGFWSVVYQG